MLTMKYLTLLLARVAFEAGALLVHLCSLVESPQDRERQRRLAHRDRQAFRRALYQMDIP